jgi:diaminopimelate decarboxylase
LSSPLIVGDLAHKQELVRRLVDAPHDLPTGDLSHVAAWVLSRRDALLAAVAGLETPCYLYDGDGHRQALAAFAAAFGARLPGHRPFYAVKANPHPLLLAEAVAAGYGLDVSSGRELSMALRQPGAEIVFSGPAKSTADLEAACDHADRIIVHLDSFRELLRLGEVTARRGQVLRAGVRVSTEHHGAWSKFGVPLADLGRFFAQARAHAGVALQGLQVHLSWNRSPDPYVRIIEALAGALARDLSPEDRAALRFIDLGGGFRPHRLEGYFPWDHPLGAAIRAADEHFGEDTEFAPPYLIKDSVPLAAYADAIGAAACRHLQPLLPGCAYFTEPGRIVATPAMHILLRVVDKKRDDLVIVDGGINMVGWERYLHIYCPVVNLSRPALREIPVRLGGSLCDCEDLWGLRCHAEAVEEGDLLLVPFQGAYTYGTAQEFIRPIPKVVPLPG